MKLLLALAISPFLLGKPLASPTPIEGVAVPEAGGPTVSCKVSPFVSLVDFSRIIVTSLSKPFIRLAIARAIAVRGSALEDSLAASASLAGQASFTNMLWQLHHMKLAYKVFSLGSIAMLT
ncbi:hypothetical protein RhiXN_10131 [Rhizoctonia solani]|uniref:Secreted protein n=1 Tax=Rhizoctonia solani TaxID=456999 RepID=A0A8H8P568_9AGAM|nr:uncharacterized protein RhiXN_10131 [Rhizoctonia solani]QRW23807.1 hypothetical protein RhiXN_10131 [Rhizoctonia solani]